MNIAKIAQLEYYKFRHYKPFIVILGLFVFCFILSGFSVKSFLDWFTEKIANDEMVNRFLGSGIPIFDFVDIWQNLAWPATLFKWIPAFVIIISVTLEYSQKTIKQNIIDGLSKREFLFSKLALVTIISIGSAVLLFLLGLFLGLLYSPVTEFYYIVENIKFIPAYALEVFVFLCMAMFFAFWLQKSGVTIIIFLIYTACIEPFFTLIMQEQFKWNLWFLPVEAINRIIRIPFPKYALYYGHENLIATDLLVATGWAIIFILLSYWLLKKRNL